MSMYPEKKSFPYKKTAPKKDAKIIISAILLVASAPNIKTARGLNAITVYNKKNDGTEDLNRTPHSDIISQKINL